MRRNSALVVLVLLVCSKSFSQTTSDADTTKHIFEKVEVEASYPGGEAAWRHFLERNLNPSVPVDNGAPYGRYLIIVQFIVDKEGRVSNIKPLTREGFGMEQEVVRIMNKSGLWTPAIMNVKPVNAYRRQPVTFMMQLDGFDIRSKTPYVLYTNTDNELTIEVNKLKDENIAATISEGSLINNGDGTYTARVSKPGRVRITVNNKKKNKEVGVMSFEVREPASPKTSAG